MIYADEKELFWFWEFDLIDDRIQIMNYMSDAEAGQI